MALKLVPGRYYRTRDGRKAGPLKSAGTEPGSNYVYSAVVTPDTDGNPDTYSWGFRGDGSWIGAGGLGDCLDLVAEWTEEENLSSSEPPLDDQKVVAAFNALVKAGRVECRDFTGQIKNDTWTTAFCTSRLKPTVRRMRLPDSPHDVVIEGNEVSVGCQRFEVRSVLGALREFKKRGGRFLLAKGGHIDAGRDGLEHQGHKITWADADALLKFLEESASLGEGKR